MTSVLPAFFHRPVESGVRVGKMQGFPPNDALPIDDACFMMLFADVDDNDVHAEHLSGLGFIWLHLLFLTGHNLLQNEKTSQSSTDSSGSSIKFREGKGFTLVSADNTARRCRNPSLYNYITIVGGIPYECE